MGSARIIEIKARSKNHNSIREYLKNNDAFFKGKDHQVDTYFKNPKGRLKLRSGTIESNLIFYNRENQSGPKDSQVMFSSIDNPTEIREVLKASLDVLVEVDKVREIYFIDNVKFHLDTVKDLGTFMEIEAIDEADIPDLARIQRQCDFYVKELEIETQDLISNSYSDMLLEAQH